jgi:hypothetical protein
MARTLTPLATLLASAFLVSTAHAAPVDLCVPETQQGPEWWNPGLSPAKKAARWQGATVRKQTQDGFSARVRSIWKPSLETVYFEYSVYGDPSLDASDAVLVALSDATGTLPELFVRFSPVAGCSNVADCDGDGVELGAGAVEYSEATFNGISITWSAMSTVDPSADFEIEHPWIAVAQDGDTHDWTLSFALHVPVDGSGEITPDLRIYGNAVMIEPGPISSTTWEFPLLCTSSSPISNDCLVYGGPDGEVPFDLPVGNMTDSWPVMESGGCGLVLVPG